MSACHCLSVALGGKYKTCEYHEWKIKQAERAKARRHQSNVERRVRSSLAEVPTSTVREPRGKKQRLSNRWNGKDRFWRAKAISENGSWNSPDYKGFPPEGEKV